MAPQQAGLDQEAQVTRDPRLALPEDLDQFAHRELGVGAEAQDAKPSGLARRAQALEKLVHFGFHNSR